MRFESYVLVDRKITSWITSRFDGIMHYFHQLEGSNLMGKKREMKVGIKPEIAGAIESISYSGEGELKEEGLLSSLEGPKNARVKNSNNNRAYSSAKLKHVCCLTRILHLTLINLAYLAKKKVFFEYLPILPLQLKQMYFCSLHYIICVVFLLFWHLWVQK